MLRDHINTRKHCWRQEVFDKFPSAQRSEKQHKKIFNWTDPPQHTGHGDGHNPPTNGKLCKGYSKNKLWTKIYGRATIKMDDKMPRYFYRCRRKMTNSKGVIVDCMKRYAHWSRLGEHWRRDSHPGELDESDQVHPGLQAPVKCGGPWWPKDNTDLTDGEDDEDGGEEK